MPDFQLKAIDDAMIRASWNRAADSKKAALFLHQRGKDHAIWDGLRKTLEARGFSTLAIDLRGHGKSDGLGKRHDLKFDQVDDYHTMYYDVTAAMDFIRYDSPPLRGGVGEDVEVVIVGSSIGANLALAYAADHFDVKAIAVFSPGLNYYGLRTDDVMIQYKHPLALISAKDDPSYADTQKLLKLPGVQRGNIWYQEYETGGHGIAILESHPELGEKIAEWMDISVNDILHPTLNS
ncbi:MAG: alpha/beta fold hydrolase [bacterium]|nr:alpha/beta fold hydrolase [bacterium]